MPEWLLDIWLDYGVRHVVSRDVCGRNVLRRIVLRGRYAELQWGDADVRVQWRLVRRERAVLRW